MGSQFMDEVKNRIKIIDSKYYSTNATMFAKSRIAFYTIDEKIKAAKVAMDICCEDSNKDYTDQYNLALWAIYLLSYTDEPSE